MRRSLYRWLYSWGGVWVGWGGWSEWRRKGERGTTNILKKWSKKSQCNHHLLKKNPSTWGWSLHSYRSRRHPSQLRNPAPTRTRITVLERARNTPLQTRQYTTASRDELDKLRHKKSVENYHGTKTLPEQEQNWSKTWKNESRPTNGVGTCRLQRRRISEMGCRRHSWAPFKSTTTTTPTCMQEFRQKS